MNHGKQYKPVKRDRWAQWHQDERLIKRWENEIVLWCEKDEAGEPLPKKTYLPWDWRLMVQAAVMLMLRINAGEPRTATQLVDDLADNGMWHPQIMDGVRGCLGALQSMQVPLARPDIAVPVNGRTDSKALWIHGDYIDQYRHSEYLD